MKASVWLTLVALLSSGAVDCAAQSPASYRGALTVTVENDVATGSDNNYTNGVGVTWVSNAIDTYEKGSLVRRWGEFWSFLPFVGNEGYRTYVSWSLAQEMHTPDDITVRTRHWTTSPMPACCTSTVRSMRERNAGSMRGSSESASSVPHRRLKTYRSGSTRWTGSDEPMGWDTQLPNEPVINVGYTGTYLLAQGDLGKSASWRVIPVASAALGNYFTGVGLGLYGEVGWNLVDAIGGTALRQGFNGASTVGVGPVERMVRVVFRRCHGLRRRPLPSARRYGVQRQPIRRLQALHRHGHVRPRRATSKFRRLLRQDVLHQDIRHRAAAPRVRNLEPVLVFLKVSTASPRPGSHRGPSATASGCRPARRFSGAEQLIMEQHFSKTLTVEELRDMARAEPLRRR